MGCSKIYKMALLLVFGICSVLFLLPVMIPGTRANCTIESIDIASGRYRSQRYIMWILVSDYISETDLYRLRKSFGGEPGTGAWRKVNTFSVGTRISPHHSYHSAFFASQKIVKAFEKDVLSQEVKKAVLANYFQLLQDGNDLRANDYADRVWKLAMDHVSKNRRIHPGDFPHIDDPASAPAQ